MGGHGSGVAPRPNRKRGKILVEECASLDANYINQLKKTPGDKEWCVRSISFRLSSDLLRVFHTGFFAPYSYDIYLDTTEPHFGSFRYWFRCPACRKRKRKLYIPIGVDQPFSCRDCLNLADRSENLTPEMRLVHKKMDLMEKLGCDSPYIGDSDKPKWMHWSTFDSKRDQIAQIDHELSTNLSM